MFAEIMSAQERVEAVERLAGEFHSIARVVSVAQAIDIANKHAKAAAEREELAVGEKGGQL